MIYEPILLAQAQASILQMCPTIKAVLFSISMIATLSFWKDHFKSNSKDQSYYLDVAKL